MPIFEYICNNCHHKFEILIRGREKPECPKCRNKKLRKLFSAFSAISGSSKEIPACGGRTPYCPEGPCSPDSCPAGSDEE